MKNTKDIMVDLVSDIGLTDVTYDYIELVKFRKYRIFSNNYNKKISFVNKGVHFREVIENRTFELGNIIKSYKVDISDNKQIENNSLLSVMRARKSDRKYQNKITKRELIQLLSVSYNYNNQNKKWNIASGGGTYPIEVFFINAKIEGIEKGIYHYNPKEKKIDLFKKKNANEIKTIIEDGYMSKYKSDIEYDKASGFIFLVAIINRASFKYEDFGYKLSLIDAGAILNNLYLAAAALNIKACACGGYLDSVFEEQLEIKAKYHNIVTSLVIGK